jgi:two-component system nitrate/nitrite response regulator NarL
MAASASRVGVVVADSHPLYLESLERNVRAWPEFELLAVADGPELLDTLQATRPHVLVVDHTTIGIERGELFACAAACSRVLLICTDPQPAEIYTAMADGASGYLAKDCPKQELCHTIAALGRGEERLGVSVQPAIASEIRLRETVPGDFLTDREREILLLMCDGFSAPAIGERLCIGLPTVKTHQHHLFEKLGASERAMAVAIALRRHLIE